MEYNALESTQDHGNGEAESKLCILKYMDSIN